MMRLISTGCAAMTATLLIGCGSKTPPAEAAPSAAAPRTAVSVSAEDNPPPPPPIAAAENADPNAEAQPTGPGDKVDPGLRAILVKFYNEQLHPAQSWDELLAGKYITKIPVGPDGKPLDWAKTMQEIGRAAVRGQ